MLLQMDDSDAASVMLTLQDQNIREAVSLFETDLRNAPNAWTQALAAARRNGDRRAAYMAGPGEQMVTISAITRRRAADVAAVGAAAAMTVPPSAGGGRRENIDASASRHNSRHIEGSNVQDLHRMVPGTGADDALDEVHDAIGEELDEGGDADDDGPHPCARDGSLLSDDTLVMLNRMRDLTTRTLHLEVRASQAIVIVAAHVRDLNAMQAQLRNDYLQRRERMVSVGDQPLSLGTVFKIIRCCVDTS